MEETLALALAALVLGGLALATALAALGRARRVGLAVERLRMELEARPPPPASPEPRVAADRLDRLADEGGALTKRVLRLEARAADRDAAPAPSLPGPSTPPVVPVARLREHLDALGYEVLHVVPVDATGRVFGVEARQGGATWKGRATVDAQGRVTPQLEPLLRAFP